MCIYCTDLDSYDSNHGHKCDDDCYMSCEFCSERLCAYASDNEDPMIARIIDKLIICTECYNKEYAYDSEGRYL